MNDNMRFPFGLPVLSRIPNIIETRLVFVLGAYPSALHVYWQPPSGKPIKAMAVDNEPEIFWDGEQEEDKIAAWKMTIDFQPEWGEIKPVSLLNGSSGRWVMDNLIKPLGVSRQDAWMSDCLDTYRCSTGLANRLRGFKSMFVVERWPTANLLPHPTENAIVRESFANHKERLIGEILAAKPKLVVTLGNAALRVFREIFAGGSDSVPEKLSPEPGRYGNRYKVMINSGNKIDLLPLMHPGLRIEKYKIAHVGWMQSQV